ncbi:MAG: LCP family protein [Lactovum sp.]
MPKSSQIRQLDKNIGIKKKHRKMRVKSISRFFLVSFILLFLLIGKLYLDATSAIKEAQISPSSNIVAVSLKDYEVFTTLIIGTSTLNEEKNLSTIDMLSINPSIKKTTVINFTPTYMLPDTTILADLYKLSGAEAVETKVASLLEAPINKVVEMDFDKIGSLVEAVGGISIQNEAVFFAEGYQFAQGTIYLQNQNETQAYMTTLTPTDSKKALSRQHDVAIALFEKIKDPKVLILHYSQIVKVFPDVIKTNITLEDFKDIAFNYRDSLKIDKINVHGEKNKVTKITKISLETVNKVKQQFHETLSD